MYFPSAKEKKIKIIFCFHFCSIEIAIFFPGGEYLSTFHCMNSLIFLHTNASLFFPPLSNGFNKSSCNNVNTNLDVEMLYFNLIHSEMKWFLLSSNILQLHYIKKYTKRAQCPCYCLHRHKTLWIGVV